MYITQIKVYSIQVMLGLQPNSELYIKFSKKSLYIANDMIYMKRMRSSEIQKETASEIYMQRMRRMEEI